MKFISMSDWHLRSARPMARIDDYHKAEINKLDQLVGFSNEYSAPILAAGDIWDSPRPGWRLYAEVQRVLLEAQWDILVVAGQHDQVFHSKDLSATPLQSLHDAGIVTIVEGEWHYHGNVSIHGCSWGDTPSKPSKEFYNILLAHISVYENTIPFYMEGKSYTARSLEEKYPGFDLLLCGDIHIPFVKDHTVVSGSMMRQSIDQKDFQPRCYLIDTDSGEIEPLYFKIEQDVFADYLVEKKEEGMSKELGELVRALKQSAVAKVDFEQACKELAVDPKTKSLIKEIFDYVR